MSLPSEVQVSINTCLEAVTQAFRDGGAIIEKIKKKRALKAAPQPPRLLEESIDQAPEEIEKERRRGVGRFGNAFIEGDHVAVIALQQITIQLQQSLLEKLRNAAFDDDTKITDFTYLVDAADMGRDRTIATLHELKQRLLNAELALNERDPGVETLQSTTPPVASPNAPSTPAVDIPVRNRTNSSLSVARTWTRDYTHSRDASGEEDAVSGAEADSSRTRQRKRSSLLRGFLKHNRTHSANEKDPIPHLPPTPAPIAQTTQSPEESRTNTRQSQSLDKGRHLSGAPPSSLANAVVYRPPPPPPANDPPSSYQDNPEWEEEINPKGIWGPPIAASAKSSERRETINTAPDAPPSPVLTHRTNSGSGSHLPSTAIPIPNPSNDYLGFCKSASRLQNADRKALTKTREVEPWSRHPSSSATALHFLSCATKSCAFRSTHTHIDTEMVWNKLLPERKGVRIRWKFLAKSHVPLRRAGSQASYQCLFCIFLQGKSGVYHGAELYLDHISSEHRASVLGDVVLFKTGCVNDRVCSEDELEWDINLYPISAANPRGGIPVTPGLSSNVENSAPFNPEDYTTSGWKARMDDSKYDSVIGANEPWNEGLSDFHYHGELDRTELE